jgi:hypothetical protein
MQDLPQLITHMIFLFALHSPIPHSDPTVIFSLVTTLIAINVSLFNIIMSKPNDFDPVLLELELKKRRDKH